MRYEKQATGCVLYIVEWFFLCFDVAVRKTGWGFAFNAEGIVQKSHCTGNSAHGHTEKWPALHMATKKLSSFNHTQLGRNVGDRVQFLCSGSYDSQRRHHTQ